MYIISLYITISSAKQIIDREFSEIDEKTVAQIEFFGGEPFLNFDLIKRVVEYIDKKYPSRAVFNTTTNGTVLNDEIKKWVTQNRHRFFVAVSVDGTERMHNLNRILKESKEGTYNLIDFDFFLNNYRPAKVKMTVAPNAVEELAEGVIVLTKRGFEVDATLAMGDIDWSDKKNIELLIEQLKLLVDFYKKNPQYAVIRMLKIPIESLFNIKKNDVTRYCGAGTRIHCYTGNELE